MNRISRESKVEQCHAFAGRCHQWAQAGIFHGAYAQRIAGHDHPTTGIEHGNIPRPVKTPGDGCKHFDRIRIALTREFAPDGVHDQLGVVVASQVVVVVGQNLGTQFRIVCQLAIETEGEPLAFLDVRAFQRLRVGSIVGPAGGIANVADGGPTGVLRHM